MNGEKCCNETRKDGGLIQGTALVGFASPEDRFMNGLAEFIKSLPYKEVRVRSDWRQGNTELNLDIDVVKD